jgi:hypothetical protein
VVVTNLPLTCSWQDLKDHMRKGGDVTFAQVGRFLSMAYGSEVLRLLSAMEMATAISLLVLGGADAAF